MMMTPLPPRTPYSAMPAGSFTTSTYTMSCGLMALRLAPVSSSIGTSSITNRGSLLDKGGAVGVEGGVADVGVPVGTGAHPHAREKPHGGVAAPAGAAPPAAPRAPPRAPAHPPDAGQPPHHPLSNGKSTSLNPFNMS